MERLNNPQTKDRIAAMLRREILSGAIADGEELAQEQLADKLEVSRMPVREALQILELEGLLLRLPNRHMRVVGLREHTIRETLRVLAAVEAELAIMLIEAGGDSSVLSSNAEYQFHSMLSGITDNPYLQQTHRRLLGGYPQYIWDNVANRPDASEAHRTIRAAIRSADEVAILATFRQYYQSLADALIAHVKENR